jgi:hypothetical protein
MPRANHSLGRGRENVTDDEEKSAII